MTNKKLIKAFVKDRDKACKSYDVKTFRRFYSKWYFMGVYHQPLPSEDMVIEILMRKCVYHMAGATDLEKHEAERWLIDHGCSTDL